MLSKKLLVPALCLSLAFLNCSSREGGRPEYVPATVKYDKSYRKVADIPLPEGYVRLPAAEGSYAAYLGNLPLKQGSNEVYLYNGSLKRNQEAHFAVLALDAGDRDLQQCADAAIRLRAEYLFNIKRHEDISFKFVSGDECKWVRYAEGWRVKVQGNKVGWYKTAGKDYSYRSFRKYLDLVFMYAGTFSLDRDLPARKVEDMSAGDVFIESRQPYGHAVTVLDMAVRQSDSSRIFMLAQSYMPAQEIEVLVNPVRPEYGPWYEIPPDKLYTPEWTFKIGHLKHF